MRFTTADARARVEGDERGSRAGHAALLDAFDKAELAEIDDMLNASENELFASMELHEWLGWARRIWPDIDEDVATSWWQFAQDRHGHHET